MYIKNFKQKTIVSLMAAGLMAISSSAIALGIGTASTQSTIGDVAQIKIPILGDADEIKGLKAIISGYDQVQDIQIGWTHKIEKTSSGDVFLVIKSKTKILDPGLNLQVSVQNSAGEKIIREQVVMMEAGKKKNTENHTVVSKVNEKVADKAIKVKTKKTEKEEINAAIAAGLLKTDGDVVNGSRTDSPETVLSINNAPKLPQETKKITNKSKQIAMNSDLVPLPNETSLSIDKNNVTKNSVPKKSNKKVKEITDEEFDKQMAELIAKEAVLRAEFDELAAEIKRKETKVIELKEKPVEASSNTISVDEPINLPVRDVVLPVKNNDAAASVKEVNVDTNAPPTEEITKKIEQPVAKKIVSKPLPPPEKSIFDLLMDNIYYAGLGVALLLAILMLTILKRKGNNKKSENSLNLKNAAPEAESYLINDSNNSEQSKLK